MNTTQKNGPEAIAALPSLSPKTLTKGSTMNVATDNTKSDNLPPEMQAWKDARHHARALSDALAATGEPWGAMVCSAGHRQCDIIFQALDAQDDGAGAPVA